MGGTLTVSERILYHLNNYIRYEDKFEVPFDVTQDGISQAISISRAHAAIELKKLRHSDLIEERLSHIKKGKSRRKAYSLTPAGKVMASTVTQYAKDNAIDPMVDPGKVVPVTNAGNRSRSSRRSSPLPSVRVFLGREKELVELRKAIDSPSAKVVSVRGIAGIGKTTLVSKLASDLTDQRVFWYTAKPWDVPRSVTDALSRFFLDNGCRKVHSCLSSGGTELGDLSVLLREELQENGYVFVFDDADCADGLQEFLRMFRHSSGSAKMVVTAENVPRFYDSSDVVARLEVVEVELGGLDRRSSLRLLESRGIRGESAERIFSITKGHPLSLEMVTASGLSEARTQVASFLEEKFYSGLSDDEKALLQFASVFNKPFPLEAIPKELRSSRKGSMLREAARGRFEVHSSLRDFVYESMSPEERAMWHSAAADFHLRDGDLQERLYHLVMARRHLEAEMLMARSPDDLLGQGNVQRLWDSISSFEPSKERYKVPATMLKARAAIAVGEYDDAWSLLSRVVDDGDGPRLSEALVEMGLIKSRRGDSEEALRLFSDALARSELVPVARARALIGMAVVEGRIGRRRRAQELLERSARESMAAMDQKGMLMAHMELGNLFMSEGRYQDAVDHFSKCAAGFGPVALTNVYMNMGLACSHMGRAGEARLHLENAVRLAGETGQPRSRAYALTSLAEIMMGVGEPEQAKEHCFRALEVFTELGDMLGTSAAYATLGMAERMSGDLKASEECYSESLKALEGVDAPLSLGMRKMEFGAMLREKGDNESAERMLAESKRLFVGLGAKDMAARADAELSALR
jgi:tetratricopeptide (TPR) repeat protein